MQIKVDPLLLLMNYETNMKMCCIYELCNYWGIHSLCDFNWII